MSSGGSGRGRGPGRAAGWAAVVAVVLALGVTACAGGVEDPGDVPTATGTDASAPDDGASSTAAPADESTTEEPASDESTTEQPSPAAPTTEEPASPTPSPTPSPTSAEQSPTPPAQEGSALPGEPYDHLYIDEGDVLGVIGVAHDDVLNLRAGPTLDAAVIRTLAPTTYGLVSTGRTQAVDGRFWHEVTVEGVTGWVSWRYVSFVGPTFDDTSRFVASRGYVRADTMAALGRDVASFYEPFDPAFTPRVVMTVAPSVGDLAEVTYDVVGIQDDAGAGYRLHVFARPDEDGGGFTLRTIEVTDLCHRGGTPTTTCP